MRTYFLFFLSIVINYSYSQVTPTVISTNGDYTYYKTSLYDQNMETINKNYDLKLKLSNSVFKAKYQTTSFDPTFLKQSINNSVFEKFQKNKERIWLLYNIDQNGKTHSCAIRIKTTSTEDLSLSEIEAILENAMQHRFDLMNIPNGVSEFLCSFINFYKFNNLLE